MFRVCVSTPVPKVLLLRAPGIATNLQFLNAEKEAGGHITMLADEASDVMGSSQRRLTVYLLILTQTQHVSPRFKQNCQVLGLAAFLFPFFSSQGLMRVKWDFVLILALASNHLSVFRHRVPLRAVV